LSVSEHESPPKTLTDIAPIGIAAPVGPAQRI
jgi:hypothetical protein